MNRRTCSIQAVLSLLVVLTLVQGSACSLAPDPEPIPVPGAQAGRFENGPVPGETGVLPWWEALADPNLTNLLRTAVSDAPDMQAAMANVAAFREQAVIAGAPQWPSLDLNATGSRTKQNLRTFFPGGGSFKTNSFGLSLSTAYELDLWGRLSNAAKAGHVALALAEASRDVVRQSLAATVSDLYFQLSAARADLEQVQTVSDAATALAVSAETGYRSGTTPLEAWLQADQARQSAAQQLAAVEQQIRSLTYRINALLGRDITAPVPTTPFATLAGRAIPIPSDLPAAVLRHRPDIRASALEVRQGLLQVGIARAQLLPSIRLTGELGYRSNELSALVDGSSSIWSLAGGIVQPLFHRGAKKAAVRKARHEAEVAVARYRKTALQAFSEVETALSARQDLDHRISLEQRKLAAARALLSRRDAAYRTGSGTLQEYLNALQAAATAEVSLHALHLKRLQNLVQLHAALGTSVARLHELMEAQGEVK